MKNKITVTIGIPAFNEEQNIELFLHSLVKQKLNSIILQKIFVNSDASTDKTNEIVKKVAKEYNNISLIENKTRKGKYFRVNELFQKNKSEVIIIVDADIAIVGNDFIETLTKALVSDPQAKMMVAHNILIRPKGFIAKVLHTHFVLNDFIRLSASDFQNAENFYGSATAYREDFARSLHIPTNLLDPHLYIYLSAKKLDGFRYCRKAEVLQYAPATIKDLKQLLNRTIGKRDKMLEKLFGENKITQSHYVSTRQKIIGTLKCFLWRPFYTPFAILLSIYLGRFARIKKVNTSPIWEINTSTKKAISYANK